MIFIYISSRDVYSFTQNNFIIIYKKQLGSKQILNEL